MTEEMQRIPADAAYHVVVQCPHCGAGAQRRRESSIRAARQALGLSRREYTARYGRSGRVARSLLDAADV